MSMRLGNAAGTTTTTLTSTAASSNKTLTLPNATDTLVGRATTDTLTNKTLTSPSLTTPTITTSFTIGSATITEAELEIIDGALCTTAELNAVADGSTSVGTTAVAAADGIVTNDGGTMQQTTAATFDTYFAATTKTLTNKTLTSPVLTTPQINDSSSDHQYVFAASELAADRVVTLPLLPSADEFTFNAMTQTLTNKTLTASKQNTSIQAGTNGADVVLNQFDGDTVARVFDGATNLETGTLDLTAGAASKGGFGFKRPVFNVTPGTDDQECTLTMAHSGAIIMVTGAAYDLDIALPAIAAGDEGFWITIVITTAFSGTNNMEVKTSGDSGDTIHLYSNDAGTTASDVAGGDVVRTQADPVAGTKLEFTCLKGGAAEQWICESIVPSGDSPTVEAAVA